MVSKRYAMANNPRVEGYDPTQPTNYITYLDAINLYGWAMSLPLPNKHFHWKRVMPTEEQIMKMKWNSKKGWILEVDLEYPAHLHDAHKDYPLAPEKKCVDVKIVRDWETDKIRKLFSSPSFARFTILGNDMAGIHMRKTKLVLNKPVQTGMTILENSKILMYQFFYNHLKARYGQKCELVYTDTDSLILDIQTEDVYKDMQEYSWL